MSIFKSFLLVGVLAYAHAGKDTVTLSPLAAEHLKAAGKPSSTVYFRINSETTPDGQQDNINTIISAVLVENKLVCDYSFIDATVVEGFIHALTETAEQQVSTPLSFKQSVIERITGSKSSEEILGIFTQNIDNAEQLTSAKLAFHGIENSEVVDEELVNGDLVAASYDFLNKEIPEEGLVLNHVQVSSIKKETYTKPFYVEETLFYIATVNGPVNKSATLYLIVKGVDGNGEPTLELQLVGIVTEIIIPGKMIKFIAGAAFIKYVSPSE